MSDKFKRLDIKGLKSDPEWKKFKYKVNLLNLEIIQDSMKLRNMGFPQRVAMLGLIIPENGGDTTPHGNGAFGLVGWRGDRAIDLPSDLPGQIHKLMEDTYNDGNFREWTHGGKGTGVLTGAEMLKLFRNTTNTMLATKAFMKGYVRPPAISIELRLALSNLILKYMK